MEGIGNTAQLITIFERKLGEDRTALAKEKDEQMNNLWSLQNGEQVSSTRRKDDVIRMCFSPLTGCIHCRQLWLKGV